jgi:hypothetical protein
MLGAALKRSLTRAIDVATRSVRAALLNKQHTSENDQKTGAFENAQVRQERRSLQRVSSLGAIRKYQNATEKYHEKHGEDPGPRGH